MTKPETETAAVELDETRLDEISGGPIYVEYEGIRGSLTPTTKAPALPGDGSVRPIGV